MKKQKRRPAQVANVSMLRKTLGPVCVNKSAREINERDEIKVEMLIQVSSVQSEVYLDEMPPPRKETERKNK